MVRSINEAANCSNFARLNVRTKCLGSLSSHRWKSVDWAKQKGLFAEILPTLDQLDKAVDQHTKRLASYAPEAVAALKKELWHNTDDWDHRLSSNAEITGRLLLSKQTQQTIQNIKNNQ
mgnify:CR=1 FL=1